MLFAFSSACKLAASFHHYCGFVATPLTRIFSGVGDKQENE
jgi:hypothetical protein